jgi:hypothetical protein
VVAVRNGQHFRVFLILIREGSVVWFPGLLELEFFFLRRQIHRAEKCSGSKTIADRIKDICGRALARGK